MALRGLNTRQRTVLVAGLAFALYWIGRWIIIGGATNGWVAYAPLSNTTSSGPFLLEHLWAQVLVWLGLVIIWIVCSLILLRDINKSESHKQDSSE